MSTSERERVARLAGITGEALARWLKAEPVAAAVPTGFAGDVFEASGPIVPNSWLKHDPPELRAQVFAPANVSAWLKEREGADAICVSLNSPGGHVAAAMEIRTMLQSVAAAGTRVDVHAAGAAQSAAVFVALAYGGGGRLTAGDGAIFMVHEASAIAAGRAGQLRSAARGLETVNKAQAVLLAPILGKKEDEVQAMLTEETWWTAAEAVDAGLVSEIVKGVPVAGPEDPDEPDAASADEFMAQAFAAGALSVIPTLAEAA